MANHVSVSRPQLEQQRKESAAAKVEKKPGPTFVMKKNAPDEFLDAAQNYYDQWGYDPSRVDSLTDVVDRLAGSPGGALKHVRIVTHGWTNTPEQFMELPVFSRKSNHPEAGKDSTYRDELLLGNPGIYAAKALMERVGGIMAHFPLTGMSDETWYWAKHAGLMHDANEVDGHPSKVAGNSEYEWGTEQAVLAAVAVLALVKACRNHSQSGVSKKSLDYLEATFTQLKDVAYLYSRAPKLHDAGKFVESFEKDAEEIARRIRNPEVLLAPLLSKKEHQELERILNESLSKGPFFTKLNQVRERLSADAEIEIRGCNVGRDQKFMDRFQTFFGVPGGKAPAVSAPTLYQVFGTMVVSEVDAQDKFTESEQALTRDALALLHDDVAVNMSADIRPVKEVLKDYHAGELSRLPKAGAETWRLRNFPLQKLWEANPKLRAEGSKHDLRALRPFELFRLSEAAPRIDTINYSASNWRLGRTPMPKKDESDSDSEKFAYTPTLRVKRGGLDSTLKQWVETMLAERGVDMSKFRHSIPVTYLTESMDNRTGMKEPGLFPGQMQFWRHINYTPARSSNNK